MQDAVSFGERDEAMQALMARLQHLAMEPDNTARAKARRSRSAVEYIYPMLNVNLLHGGVESGGSWAFSCVQASDITLYASPLKTGWFVPTADGHDVLHPESVRILNEHEGGALVNADQQHAAKTSPNLAVNTTSDNFLQRHTFIGWCLLCVGKIWRWLKKSFKKEPGL